MSWASCYSVSLHVTIPVMDIERARNEYEGANQLERYGLAMSVTKGNSSPVRQAAREELACLIEEWNGEAPSRLLRRVRAQIAALR